MLRNDYFLYSIVWLLLVMLTFAAWVIGHQAPIAIDGPPLPIAASILGLAFVKVAMIMAIFMDLRVGPFGLITLAATWIVIECAALLALIAQ
ncbi:cytochrome C oxidase subunit IV family protein [Sphingobium sp. JS3065]|uniref:cytochrome C oxidase subunit IV family protein n=1 Tax=Sphingobium sp. JS3065 TaxID=2970925 RepID=UPI0022655C91|nr:cytochrome C oxidase subunit IV family protein [Sphingobium sp. JS3065]UZW57039.1 cytochrome C oxidase subunit IV family protein [Sphingobium sp. JS3065]